MASDMTLETADPAGGPEAAPRQGLVRRFRKHAFLSFVIAGALLGGGLRFVPAGTAASTNLPGKAGASTACSAS